MLNAIARTWLLVLLTLPLGQALAQGDHREAIAYFENSVRPIFVQHCIKCHGPNKSESGLRLDNVAKAMQGGDSGPAIAPGEPDKSLLVKAIRHEDGLAMPPEAKLKPHEVESLVQWIAAGAAWPEDARPISGLTTRSGPITAEQRQHWSFLPIIDPKPPRVEHLQQVQSDIDRFVISRLSHAGLAMRSPANKRTLLRRATFDLIGLPPTLEDYEAFERDESPHALDEVVNRLLASPAYGQRWGRHWLDVVRYADTAGETADYPTPLAYKYRNWVIEAFNVDKPYDQFIREQIAGDILAKQMIERLSGDADASMLDRYRDMVTATGFIAISRRFGFDIEKYQNLTIQDTIDCLGQAVLGLSLGCARCHDHKYDPINIEDYYSWYGIFESTRYSFPGSEQKKRPSDLVPALPPQIAEPLEDAHNQRLIRLAAEIEQLSQENKSLEGEIKALSESGGDERSLALNDSTSRLTSGVKRLAEFTAESNRLKSNPPFHQIYGAVEGDQPKHAQIQLRGDRLRPGTEVLRRNLEILGGDPLEDSSGSGRLELARWLTRPGNPLLARVMVNRIWQHHFGRGLVATENDFGARGEASTHPELLDWLASRFIESGWSIKAMHRLIMSSATYQQDSEFDFSAAQLDPDARLLWRFNRRPLTGDELRDAMLFVSGDLDHSAGGEHPFPPMEKWNFTQHSPYYAVYETNRRSVYVMQQRLKRHPILGLFDGADTNASTPRRGRSTVPTQSLFLMNSEFVHARASSIASWLLQTGDATDDRITRAFNRVLGRQPNGEELLECRTFIAEFRGKALENPLPDRDASAWQALTRTLLVRNEFLFVD